MKKALEALNMISPVELKQRIENVREGLKIQESCAKTEDKTGRSFAYQHGMYNGIEYALTILEDRESHYMDSSGVIGGDK